MITITSIKPLQKHFIIYQVEYDVLGDHSCSAQLPERGQIHNHGHARDSLNTAKWKVSVKREGFQITFIKPPPKFKSPFLTTAYHPTSDKFRVLKGLPISEMLEKSFMKIIRDIPQGFYSRISLNNQVSETNHRSQPPHHLHLEMTLQNGDTSVHQT